MVNKLRNLLVAALVMLSTSAVFAQSEESLMTYDLATTAMNAAEAYAREQGWNVTILITDQNNNVVMVRRLDGAGARTWDFATAKALVVNETGLTSGEYGTRREAGTIDEVEGGVTFAGGVPVFVNGQRIGAIATSGVRANQDEEVSVAGAEAIGSASN
ncbi:MAG: heme-binding protein [Gammaproteobacteria bacterium]|jgi:uncharacterized protein GlcG (DUF336 family)